MTEILRPPRRRTTSRRYPDTGELLIKFVHSNPGAVILTTRNEGRFLVVNEGFLNLVGYDRNEVINRTAMDLKLWRNEEQRQQMLNMLRNNPTMRDFETTFQNRKGDTISIHCSVDVVFFQNQRCLLSMVTDISERKRFENLLRTGTHNLVVASDLARTLAETSEPQQIFGQLSKVVHLVLSDLRSVTVSLYNDVQQTIETVYMECENHLIDTRSIPKLPLAPPHLGVQSEVIHSKKPMLVPDLDKRLQSSKQLIRLDKTAPYAKSGLLAPMVANGRVLGVVLVQSLKPNHFTENDLELLSLLANTSAIALENALLIKKLAEAHSLQVAAFDRLIEGWGRAMEVRNQEMEGHTRRVAGLAVELGRMLGLRDEELVDLRRGSLLHDIGKMVIPDYILLKPGALSEEEWAIMRLHPTYALHMLQPFNPVGAIRDIPLCHHERWDGKGYPNGLMGQGIPLSARIFTVVDVYDALTSERPYRPAWTEDKALEYIASEAGKRFDPYVVEHFLILYKDQFPFSWMDKENGNRNGSHHL